MAPLFWTPEALSDRRAIYGYIERDNSQAAIKLDEMISKKATALQRAPGLGKPGRVANTRELVVHKHYIIVYDVIAPTPKTQKVRILRVLHTSRLYP